MSVIKRIFLEVELQEHPLMAGESLFKYAERMIAEAGIDGVVLAVESQVRILDVSTWDALQTIGGPETMTIECRTRGME